LWCNAQDILRLLTLWFNHGASVDVQQALEKGFGSVPVETWLAVLPQIIARIHSNTPAVRTLIQRLLIDIGKGHPQVKFLFPQTAVLKNIYRRTFQFHSASFVPSIMCAHLDQ
jgi:FKBP12-rapamycin complex-associated protein